MWRPALELERKLYLFYFFALTAVEFIHPLSLKNMKSNLVQQQNYPYFLNSMQSKLRRRSLFAEFSGNPPLAMQIFSDSFSDSNTRQVEQANLY